MKKAICLILVMLVTFSCSVSLAQTEQDSFLSDMLMGIRERLSLTGNEEDISFYESCANSELNRIKKYKNATFEDERFSILARQYIDACEMQLNATKLYPAPILFQALWTSGMNARAAIILELYESYGLALTQDEAAQYYWNLYSIEEAEPNNVDISEAEEYPISISNTEVNYSYGYYTVWFTFQNNGEETLTSISYTAKLLDPDNTILSANSAKWTSESIISPGQKIRAKYIVNSEDFPTAAYLQINKIYYDTETSKSKEIQVGEEEAQKYRVMLNKKTNATTSPVSSSSPQQNSVAKQLPQAPSVNSLALKQFVSGYNCVADAFSDGKYGDRLTIFAIKASYFGEHKDIASGKIDENSLEYSGKRNGEPIIIVLGFDENENLKSVNLTYGLSNDSSSDYGTQTQMLNLIGYIEAVISGFDVELDYEKLTEELLTGLLDAPDGKVGDKQYQIKEPGFSAEATLAFGMFVIIISR